MRKRAPPRKWRVPMSRRTRPLPLACGRRRMRNASSTLRPSAIADLLGVVDVEACIRRTIDTVALVAAKQPESVRAAAVAWFRNELMDLMPQHEALRGKDMGALADALAERLVKRIDEIEAGQAGRA